jgi:hypothetical protein
MSSESTADESGKSAIKIIEHAGETSASRPVTNSLNILTNVKKINQNSIFIVPPLNKKAPSLTTVSLVTPGNQASSSSANTTHSTSPLNQFLSSFSPPSSSAPPTSTIKLVNTNNTTNKITVVPFSSLGSVTNTSPHSSQNVVRPASNPSTPTKLSVSEQLGLSPKNTSPLNVTTTKKIVQISNGASGLSITPTKTSPASANTLGSLSNSPVRSGATILTTLANSAGTANGPSSSLGTKILTISSGGVNQVTSSGSNTSLNNSNGNKIQYVKIINTPNTGGASIQSNTHNPSGLKITAISSNGSSPNSQVCKVHFINRLERTVGHFHGDFAHFLDILDNFL